MKALYLDDTITTCECCGRTELKATVAMQLSDGGILHYGRTCAARNSGKNQKQIKTEIYAEQTRQENRRRKMQSNAEALAAYLADDLNHTGLEVQRRNYHQTGGFSVNGKFQAWLEARAAGVA
jgi:hypothetical protein